MLRIAGYGYEHLSQVDLMVFITQYRPDTEAATFTCRAVGGRSHLKPGGKPRHPVLRDHSVPVTDYPAYSLIQSTALHSDSILLVRVQYKSGSSSTERSSSLRVFTRPVHIVYLICT